MDTKHNTGLSEKTIDFICFVMKQYAPVESVILFGSRAKGTFHEGSDIDICLKTSDAFSYKDLLHITRDFDESSLPYTFDILEYNKLTNRELIDHIDQVGIPLYIRQERAL